MKPISTCVRRLLILAFCFSGMTPGFAQQKPPPPGTLEAIPATDGKNYRQSVR